MKNLLILTGIILSGCSSQEAPKVLTAPAPAVQPSPVAAPAIVKEDVKKDVPKKAEKKIEEAKKVVK